MQVRILVADDDEITLDIVEHLLTELGHEVVTCASGAEALELLECGNFQLAILDWEMPGMSGLEVCRHVRQGSFANYIYVIMLTARRSDDEIVMAMSSGADDYIAKPFNVNELRTRVQAGIRVLSLEMRDTLIFTLAKLAESRDTDTGQHLERVQAYSRCLAKHLLDAGEFRPTIDSHFVRNIFLTSPLHDIGKVGIPDRILLKQARFEPEEFEIMKTHTLLGASTLKEARDANPSATYLKMAYDIARSHHERYDGSGYPDQLSGDDIPLAARIVALADTYDALRSKRVYKEAYTHENTREIIVSESGQHFDPRVVSAFLAQEAEFLSISARFCNDDELSLQRLLNYT